jgi:hypothetical protein
MQSSVAVGDCGEGSLLLGFVFTQESFYNRIAALNICHFFVLALSDFCHMPVSVPGHVAPSCVASFHIKQILDAFLAAVIASSILGVPRR